MSQAEEKTKEFMNSLQGLSAHFMYEKIEKKVKELFFEIEYLRDTNSELEENLFNKEACQVTDDDMQVFNDDEFSEFSGYCEECLEYYPACECENEK